MGTTATVAVLLDSELYVAHVGDSRAYLVRNRRAQQLTTDHSVLQHLIDSGATGAMAAAAEQRHALLRALGPEADVRVDVSCTPVEHGDIVVLCSDGAWSAVAAATTPPSCSPASKPLRSRRSPSDRGAP